MVLFFIVLAGGFFLHSAVKKPPAGSKNALVNEQAQAQDDWQDVGVGDLLDMQTAVTQEPLAEDFAQTPDTQDNNSRSEENERIPDLTNLYSSYAVLLDAETGEVLAEHRSREVIFPASLTKIMTALLVVENAWDLDTAVTIPADIFPALYEKEASMAGFLPDETVSLRDLLYGILLPSGAECSIAAAVWLSGSEAAFVELMNQRARELGMYQTHFCNCTGLHENDHYSTVQDLGTLLQYALGKEAFRSAFTARRYSTAPTGLHSDGITFYSTMFQSLESAKVPGGEILGGKTGYTSEAGQCLASLANVAGREYLLVTAKAEGTHETQQFSLLDAVSVYSQIGG